MTPAADDDRRRFARIHLDETIPARLGGTAVSIVEVSVTGFLLAHEARITPAQKQQLVAQWGTKPIDAMCNVTRSTLYRVARNPGESSIYHSGANIVETIGPTDLVIRELIEDRVLRALEEQKANARGIPPVNIYSAPQKGDRYRRCELAENVWKKIDTNNSSQPLNGFTISAEVDPRHIDLLCETYATGNAEVRRLTRILAQLSINKNEGTATRKYIP